MAYEAKLDKVIKEFDDVEVMIVNNVVDYSFKFKIKSYNDTPVKLVITRTYKDRNSGKSEETPKIGRIPLELIPQFIDRLQQAQEFLKEE